LTTQQLEREAEGHRRERLEALIAGAVLRALGRPDDLRYVQVRWLWDQYCRVNVLTGGESATPAIAHSYFLVTDGAGEILEASPTITRRY
jgi:hypothetical protein